MVIKEKSVYLFVGEDTFAKARQLAKLKKDFLSPETQDFNLDILYAKELDLFSLQEKLLSLPLKSKKRIIVVKDINRLRQNIKDFLINYVKSPAAGIILVLDAETFPRKDEFLKKVSKHANLYRFREPVRLDAFALCRSIDSQKAAYSLRILHQLIKNGEKPERILGGLRYAWERNEFTYAERKKRLRLLVNCDAAIKTGRLKAVFALERLIVDLCCFGKPSS
ncbi:MAG: hypothetical protein DRP74_06190 [Candidatus Omnitrophota bacterium]|nr:MAG: hypothetical protein DRP74_06190 [Candidatus Omnitrophota bacterium]